MIVYLSGSFLVGWLLTVWHLRRREAAIARRLAEAQQERELIDGYGWWTNPAPLNAQLVQRDLEMETIT